MGLRLIAAIAISIHLMSCQSNEAVSMQRKSDAKTMAEAYETKITLILERIIGQHTHGESSSIYQVCRIAEHQVENLTSVRSKIFAAKKEEIQEAMHIVAVIPSITYFAYHGDKQILLRDSYSTTKYRDGPASKELMALIDGYCKLNE